MNLQEYHYIIKYTYHIIIADISSFYIFLTLRKCKSVAFIVRQKLQLW